MPSLTASVYEALRRRQCVPRSETLSSSATPWQVLQALDESGESDVVFLAGDWAADSVLISVRPMLRAPAGEDPAVTLAAQPALAASAADVVGGGWFGVLGYDAVANHLAFYDHVLRWSSQDGWRLEMLHSAGRAAELAAQRRWWCALLARAERQSLRASDEAPWKIGPFRPAREASLAQARDRHLAAVEQAIGRVRRGDIYQVNVCTRFAASFAGSAAAMFAEAARQLSPAKGAYLRWGDEARQEIASFSPELFLQRRGGLLLTRPIKGTRPVGGVSISSSESGLSRLKTHTDHGARALAASAKDIAENVMIVDLMRNDLARVCVPGSVTAPDLLRIESHIGVWHLISTVQGEVRDGCDDGAVIEACFPPGSVTGAPKIKATEVIAAVEPNARRAYTGALGFASPCWGVEFSVLIRALEIAGGVAEIGVGGGVTSDSVAMTEWAECLDKLRPVAAACRSQVADDPRAQNVPIIVGDSLLETMLSIDGQVLRLADHLGRLGRSAAEFGACLPADLAARVTTSVKADAPVGRWIVRLVATVRRGEPVEVAVSCAPVSDKKPPSGVGVASRSARLWRHKWADREELSAIEAAVAAAFPGSLPLFLDQAGDVAELSRGNVFLFDGVVLATPPSTDETLAGVTRQAVLDCAADLGLGVQIRRIKVEELRAPDTAAFWTSAVSGITPIDRLDGTSLVTAPAAELAAVLREMLGFGR